MARLALAVAEEKRFGVDGASFRISTRAAQMAHAAFGETILVYRRSADFLAFVGTGRVMGLDFGSPGSDVLRLSEFRAFAVPVHADGLDELRDPGVRRSLSIDDERFEQIVRDGLSAHAAEEAGATFAAERAGALEAYLKVHDRVLQRWRYRCVFTGAEFEPSATRPHPDLNVVAIRPRELGGQLHVRNYLPMVRTAEDAWRRGHITLGPNFGFQVSERLVDPEFRESLLPLGALDLPAEPSQWPDSQAVAFHRANIFDRD